MRPRRGQRPMIRACSSTWPSCSAPRWSPCSGFEPSAKAAEGAEVIREWPVAYGGTARRRRSTAEATRSGRVKCGFESHRRHRATRPDEHSCCCSTGTVEERCCVRRLAATVGATAGVAPTTGKTTLLACGGVVEDRDRAADRVDRRRNGRQAVDRVIRRDRDPEAVTWGDRPPRSGRPRWAGAWARPG